MVETYQQSGKLKLDGFNNLTKSLSFNIYDICYAQSAAEQQAYISYIDEEYNAQRLTNILTECVNIIGANILNIAHQDYEPQGASVTILICEDPMDAVIDPTKPDSIVAHLDKSHMCVHTYPEMHRDNGISTFRADIELATCGEISPLTALNYLLRSFEADVVDIDYRVRGFTRDIDGTKHWVDHDMSSIQRFIDPEIIAEYECVDSNLDAERLYHTKMRQKDVDLDTYVFGGKHVNEQFTEKQRSKISARIREEIQEIFYCHNIS